MRKKIELGKNTYQSAKVSVVKGSLFTDSDFASFASMGYEEILKNMSKGEFKDIIDSSYMHYEGFYLIEKILNTYLSKMYSKFIISAPKKTQILMNSYYLKYQIHNLMVLVRCRLGNEKDISPYLIGDYHKQEKFLKAQDMPSIEDALIYLSKKLGFDEKIVLQNYNKSVFDLENYLYKTYYERLNSFIFTYNKRDEREFEKFIKGYIDLINVRSYGKLLEEGNNLPFNEIFISGGSLPISFFTKFEKEDLEKYLNSVSKALSLDDVSSFIEIDKIISKHKRHASEKLFKNINFGSPFYALRFLFELEQYMARLRILLKAKFLNLPENEIRELI